MSKWWLGVAMSFISALADVRAASLNEKSPNAKPKKLCRSAKHAHHVCDFMSDPCSSSDSAVLAAWVRGICIRLPSCFANSLWSAARS
jgi:hypothetical protein